MEKLRQYLRTFPRGDGSRERFAAAIGTTMGYIRNAMGNKKEFNVRTCIRIEDESNGFVMLDDLIPDVDWDAYFARRQARLKAKARLQKVAA